jgi:hypothetical protein
MNIGLVTGLKQKLIKNMELEQKIELNKQIRKYTGSNTFVISLQKQLKTNKYLSKVEWKGKEVKILSDKQYQAAISSLS